jgi:ABC-2 type transport system permease protein
MRCTAVAERLGGWPAVVWAARCAAVIQVREMVAAPMTIVVTVIQPAVFLVLAVRIRSNPDAAFVDHAVTGSAMTALWSTTLWSAGGILRRERLNGTLVTVLARPAPLAAVLLGRTLAVGVAGIGFISASTAVTAWALGVHPRLPGAGALLVIGGLAVSSVCALGILLSSVMVLTRSAPRVQEALVYPVFIAGGLMIPPRLLPWPVAWPSKLIGFRFVVELTGEAAAGTPLSAGAIAWTVTLTALYLAVGAVVMETSVRRSRVRGTIDLA